ncbi:MULTISPECIES: LytR C-terminal domain-containing protein [unclassified Actinotalea]|uniref:LytR C-terminal domain-containing protein n=1 Tax=unclassified Actinotalea TaxID=2638618 RepID=UPI0015F52315|nr:MULTISPECIES: LytR C-terminal domain-containing protein [unclassified Actinotalea]
MEETAADRERRLRRRRQHERQAVVFGSLIAALAVAGLGSAAVYTGVISAPFLDREFSTPPPDAGAAALPPPPCPPEGTLPVQYNTVTINVLNGAGTSGLAGSTRDALTARGFAVLTAGNYPAKLPGTAQITFGEAGLAAAYTLAAHVTTPTLVLDQRADASVDLVLGQEFGSLVESNAVVLDQAAPLTGVAGCVPLEEARAAALPAPAAPEEAPAEGEAPAEEGAPAEGEATEG